MVIFYSYVSLPEGIMGFDAVPSVPVPGAPSWHDHRFFIMKAPLEAPVHRRNVFNAGRTCG
jgi:hypothetical protein